MSWGGGRGGGGGGGRGGGGDMRTHANEYLYQIYSSFQVGCPKIAMRIRACAHFRWGF